MIEVAMARYGHGYLDLSGSCVTIEYPLNEQLGLLESQRARKYPFPGGLDVERFTIYVLEPINLSESSYSRSYVDGRDGESATRFYVDARDGESTLVEETYRDGVLHRIDTHRHGDRLSTSLPWLIVDWLVPVPRNCPSQWMRLGGNSGIFG